MYIFVVWPQSDIPYWYAEMTLVPGMGKSFDQVKDADIPFYAGLLISMFTFCEFLSGMAWAKVSDWIGRKPTLLIGTFCGIIAAISFRVVKLYGCYCAVKSNRRAHESECWRCADLRGRIGEAERTTRWETTEIFYYIFMMLSSLLTRPQQRLFLLSLFFGGLGKKLALPPYRAMK